VPPIGWVKLNTDGSFGTDGEAGAGIIVQDHKEDIVLSSCRHLINCRDAFEAELSTVREGLSLALQWFNQPVLIETDCLELIKRLQSEEMDRSVYATMIKETKGLLKVQQTCITHIKRCQNISSISWQIMLEQMPIRPGGFSGHLPRHCNP
jgi:ribonuclease HI